jgi:hypothetical protein
MGFSYKESWSFASNSTAVTVDTVVALTQNNTLQIITIGYALAMNKSYVQIREAMVTFRVALVSASEPSKQSM